MNFNELDENEQAYINSIVESFDVNISKTAKTYLVNFVTDTNDLQVALAFIEGYAKLMHIDIYEPEQIEKILNYSFKQEI